MSQVIKDYTHPLQKHFLPFTEDMNRNAVKLYFPIAFGALGSQRTRSKGVEYARMQVH
jgi:hypothetical protein